MKNVHILPSFFGHWRVCNWNEWFVSLYLSLYMPWYYMVGEYLGSKFDWWRE